MSKLKIRIFALTMLALSIVGLHAEERLELTAGWRVLIPHTYDHEAIPKAPASNDKRWVSLEQTRTRQWRLANYYEPGQPLWLEKAFTVPAGLKGKDLVLLLPNRITFQRAYLNGRELRDLSHDAFHLPETAESRRIPEKYPKFTNIGYKWERKDLRVRRYGHYSQLFNNYGEPARLLVTPDMLKRGENRLTLQIWDYDDPATGTLLGNVTLGEPSIYDALLPFAYSRPKSAFAVEGVVGIDPRINNGANLQVQIEVYDNVGKLLRTEKKQLTAKGGTAAETTIDRKTADDYRAKVTMRNAEGDGIAQWIYFIPIVEHTDTKRSRYNLEGADWEYQVAHKSGAPSFPLSEQNWVPTYAPSTQISNAEHYLKRTVDHILLRKKFEMPKTFHGERFLLRLGGSSINFKNFGKKDPDTKVYLNGKKLGTFAFDQATVEFDVTNVIRKSGKNELLMTPTRFVREKIELIGVPAVRVHKQWLVTSVAKKTLTVKTWLRNDSGKDATVTLKHVVRGKEGIALTFGKSSKAKIPAGKTIKIERTQSWSNPNLWAPWSPNLYELQTAVLQDGSVLDRCDERFGFREFAIDGENIRINGEILHLRGENGLLHPDLFGRMDMSTIANRIVASKQAGYNMSREDGGVPPMYWYLCDDLGFLGNYNAGPSDMGRGWVIQQPPEFFDAVNSMFTTYISENYNHPAIILWNYGNELPAQRSKYLENQIIEALNEMKAFDPTRIVTADGTHLPVEKVETINPHYASSPYYAWDRETIEKELIPRTGEYIMDPHQRSYWERNKPLICGEYNWAHVPIGTSDYYAAYGEQQMKPTPRLTPDLEGEEPPSRVAMWTGYVNERLEDMKWFRAGGISGYVLLGDGFLNHDMVDPISGAFYSENRRFWSGDQIRQWIAVFNDSGSEAQIQLELRYENKTQWKKTVTLKQGGRQMVESQSPAITVTDPTRIRAELIISAGGKVLARRYREWEFFPHNWVQPPTNVEVAVYDPSGFAHKLFSPLGIQPQNVVDITDVARSEAKLLVLGEDLDPQIMGQAAEALRQYVTNGGTLFVLRQEEILWLPVEAKVKPHGKKGKHEDLSQAVMLGTTHPIFTDLLPEDLRDWGKYGTVAARDYGIVREGNARSLTDLGSLVEAKEEKGRYLLTTLEFTPENVKNEPVVTKLLSNILRYAATPIPEPARTLVYFGGKGKRAKTMQGTFRLRAEYRSDEPQSLTQFDLAILCDWNGKTPSDAFAAGLRKWVSDGGTLLVQNIDPTMQSWLSKALNVPIHDRKVITRRAVTLREDKLLEGIGDVYLGWWNTAKRDSYFQTKTSGNDIIRREVLPAGAKVLTFPAVLVKRKIGKGRLVIDQSRWTEISGERRFYWSYDSRFFADKYMSALLINLGAYMDYKKQVGGGKVVRNMTHDLMGSQFHSVDLSAVVNRARTDARKGDGKGWIDLGPGYALSKLESGKVSAKGIPFTILDEGRNNGKSVIMLRSKEKFTDLLTETDKINVGRKADAILFLHTAAFVQSGPGVTAWEYEIHYKGFGGMIYGSDVSDYVNVAPVKVKLDVDDWLKDDPAITPACSFGGGNNSTAQNLYVLRWSNPRPEVPIETIAIRSKLKSEVPIILGITTASKPDFVFEAGQFEPGKGKFPEGWSTNKDWMKGNAKVMDESGNRFVRIDKSPTSMSCDKELPAGTKTVTVSTRVRLRDYKRGGKGWDIPTIIVSLTGSNGKSLINSWKHGFKFRSDQDWKVEKKVYKVPEGARRIKIDLNHKAETGIFDVGQIVILPSK